MPDLSVESQEYDDLQVSLNPDAPAEDIDLAEWC